MVMGSIKLEEVWSVDWSINNEVSVPYVFGEKVEPQHSVHARRYAFFVNFVLTSGEVSVEAEIANLRN